MTKSTTERKMTRAGLRITGLASLMATIALLLAGSPGAIANGDQPAPAAAEVKIDNFSFGPVALTVAAGTTVTWTNRDDIPHTVVSTDGAFKSKVLDTDEKFSYKFAKAGTFAYFCSIHPKMTGKVVVR
jgi:plastocyanin